MAGRKSPRRIGPGSMGKRSRQIERTRPVAIKITGYVFFEL